MSKHLVAFLGAMTVAQFTFAQNTSVITQQAYDKATCVMLMDVLRRDIYDLQARIKRLVQENDELRNEAEKEDT